MASLRMIGFAAGPNSSVSVRATGSLGGSKKVVDRGRVSLIFLVFFSLILLYRVLIPWRENESRIERMDVMNEKNEEKKHSR